MLAPLLALALLTTAHSRSEGKSTFRLDESGRVTIAVTLADADLPELCNVDLTVAERAREEAELSRCLEEGLARWLRLSGDARPCPVAFRRWSGRERTVLIEADALCAAMPRTLVIDWGLFAGAPLDHVSVATVEEPHGKPRMVLLSKRSSRFVLEVARPWWPFALGGGALAAALGAMALRWRRRRVRAADRARG